MLFPRHCKCNNPCVAQIESRLYRNSADIATFEIGLAEIAAHFAKFCIIYCCLDNTVDNL